MTSANLPSPPAPGVQATVPLTARLEPWMTQLAEQPRACADALRQHGSPVNVVYPPVLPRNAGELVEAGRQAGVDVRVYFARKSNKALAFVDAAAGAGHGVDVASERELTQVLRRGVPGERIILSAAVKPDSLLDIAIRAGVAISVDCQEELERIHRRFRAICAEQDAGCRAQLPGAAAAGGTTAAGPATPGPAAPHTAPPNAASARTPGRGVPARPRVAPRIAPDPALLPPTRFGERVDAWRDALCGSGDGRASSQVDVVGVHLHLHGYAEADRRLALGEALDLVDHLHAAGHRPHFVDLGGGVPMSYLDSDEQWRHFHEQLRAQNTGEREPFTWKADPLATVYPFHQSPVRGPWLAQLLAGSVHTSARGTQTAAEALTSRGLRLHLEPGRSVLDGGGVILARVAFVKRRSDGVGLVGLEMNRTQCRTTSDDILLDPLLLQTAEPEASEPRAERPNRGFRGFLVGAYCIEDEVIIRREMTFPDGVAPGDAILIPNTAGYFMHILESASHQIPLAKNVVFRPEPGQEGPGFQLALDGIDLALGGAEKAPEQ